MLTTISVNVIARKEIQRRYNLEELRRFHQASDKEAEAEALLDSDCTMVLQ